MAEALAGLIIAAISISSLILSIESIEKSFRNAGRHSITKNEVEVISSAGINTEQNINTLKNDIKSLPQKY
tara:strand:- start:1616 stop:1828 length:213 start_codon:yes stop_codon:yes gene_type:complete